MKTTKLGFICKTRGVGSPLQTSLLKYVVAIKFCIGVSVEGGGVVVGSAGIVGVIGVWHWVLGPSCCAKNDKLKLELFKND